MAIQLVKQRRLGLAYAEHSLDRQSPQQVAANVVGRFVRIYFSLGWNDSYTSCGGVQAAGRS